MARGLLEQREHPDYDALGFEERLGMLVDRELTERHNRRLDRMLKAAHLRTVGQRRRHRLLPAHGASSGPRSSPWPSRTGSARTTRSSSWAPPGWARPTSAAPWPTPAIRRGHSALYLRGPRLHDEIALARADGRLPRLMAAWARTDVLVIDDFLLRPLAPDQAADLLEVIEDRVGLRSTIVTSQLPVAMWHEALGEPTVADGILDRLLENVHRIELHGESLRRHPPARTAASRRHKAPERTPATKNDPLQARQSRCKRSRLASHMPGNDRLTHR